jgi:hypothetical protein
MATGTTVRMPVWERAARQAEVLAARGQNWQMGKPGDATAVWAAGAGRPSYRILKAGEGAIAVVQVEWRRPEGFDDDDASTGGYLLHTKSGTVRVAAHASVFREADGTVRLGRWISEDGRPRELSAFVRAIVDEVRDWPA